MYDNYSSLPATEQAIPTSEVVPPVKKYRPQFKRLPIPFVAQVAAGLSLLLLVAGLLTARELAQSPQDLSTMAQTVAPMDFSIQPSTATMAVNEEKLYDVQLLTNGRTASAAKVIVTFDPAFIQANSGMFAEEFFPNILQDMGTGPGSLFFTVGANPRKLVNGTSKVFTFRVKALKKGTTKITIAPESEAAAIGLSTNQAKVAGDLTLTIGDPAPPPTGTVCWNYVTGTGENLNWPNACKGTPINPDLVCAAVITPLTADEKTQYRAWQQAGSIIPAACTGSTNSADPRLNLGFRVQGVVKSGVTKTAEVTIRYKKKNSAEIVKKSFTHTFISAEASTADSTPIGMFKSAQPLVLTGVNLSEIDTTSTQFPTFGTGIEVFVKTPTSLRKKLGELTYQNNQPPAVLRGMFPADNVKLVIGDFDRSSAQQINVIRSSDVGKLLSQFSDISHPITGPTDPRASFDIDNNGVLNSFDLSLLLTNLKDISVKGEEP